MRRHEKNAGGMLNPIYGYGLNGKRYEIIPVDSSKPSPDKTITEPLGMVVVAIVTVIAEYSTTNLWMSLFSGLLGFGINVYLHTRYDDQLKHNKFMDSILARTIFAQMLFLIVPLTRFIVLCINGIDISLDDQPFCSDSHPPYCA